ncbi:hypothetical protein LDENG_00070780 [Lucifuga dentata]|nr:hypothetical protein LDENG_00070780 [Lucifuga dentata]
MLFLSSGTVDAIPRSAAIGEQQQQGKTVYHISVILKEVQHDELLSELGMGWVTDTLVENCQPRREIISVVPMENSPRLGRAGQELGRWPSLSRTGRAGRFKEEIVVEENEEESEGVGGKMKTDRFLKQPFKNSDNSSERDRDVAVVVATATHTENQEQHIRGSALGSVTVQTKGLVLRDHGIVSGYRSLPRAVLRRPRLYEASLGRRTVSMYGDPLKQQRDSQPEQERPLQRPNSGCMLAGPVPVLLDPQTQQSFGRAGVLENTHQYRSRKAELRAVDGLNSFVSQRPSVPTEVTPRVRQRGWKPRPLSMTVLELRKRGSDDEIDSQRSCSHTGSDAGGFLKGGFRWRLFGKAPQDRCKERENDKDVKSSPRLSKTDAPKRTLGSLRRSLSLRLRRTRTRDRITVGSEGESREYTQTNSATEETTMPLRPFSYLTGRTLPLSSEKVEDRGMQYIQYHNKGKVKVMEVPLYPTKLSRPAPEEQSIWQLIANRFRRKEQPCSGTCDSQQFQSKDTSQYPLVWNKKPQSVAIETLKGIGCNKGQGKICKTDEFIFSA